MSTDRAARLASVAEIAAATQAVAEAGDDDAAQLATDLMAKLLEHEHVADDGAPRASVISLADRRAKREGR